MKNMNAVCKKDYSTLPWTYCNVTKKKAKGFEQARKQGKYLINCVDGVQWALRIANPKMPISWYGGNGTIVWLNDHSKADVKKYFKIIKTGGKTVSQLYKAGSLCDGDIPLGYQGFCHTNAYFGGGKSFDSGHAYASPKSGEGAKIKKLIGSLAHKGDRVNYILRLKDRAHYRVQAGAYTDKRKYDEQAGAGRLLLRKNQCRQAGSYPEKEGVRCFCEGGLI